MARKRRKKGRRRKKSSSVGKRARKYYVSVKRNKKYRRKKRKSSPGKQMTMFGPRYRVRHSVKRIGRKRRRTGQSMGQTQGAGAWTSAHNKIV